MKARLARTKLFWRFRHWLEPKWYETYFNDWGSKRRERFVELAREARNGHIVEYGCASAPNLFAIKFLLPNTLIVGIDISRPAIKFAEKKFREVFPRSQSTMFFRTELPVLPTFPDLLIFDRSAYLLSLSELEEVLERTGAKRVVIDDFFVPPGYCDVQGEKYGARDYDSFMSRMGYGLESIEKSGHQVTSTFHAQYARLCVFRKRV